MLRDAAEAPEHGSLTIEEVAEGLEGVGFQIASELEEVEGGAAFGGFIGGEAEASRAIGAEGGIGFRDIERDGFGGFEELSADMASRDIASDIEA